jgi:hypothetical protein
MDSTIEWATLASRAKRLDDRLHGLVGVTSYRHREVPWHKAVGAFESWQAFDDSIPLRGLERVMSKAFRWANDYRPEPQQIEWHRLRDDVDGFVAALANASTNGDGTGSDAESLTELVATSRRIAASWQPSSGSIDWALHQAEAILTRCDQLLTSGLVSGHIDAGRLRSNGPRLETERELILPFDANNGRTEWLIFTPQLRPIGRVTGKVYRRRRDIHFTLRGIHGTVLLKVSSDASGFLVQDFHGDRIGALVKERVRALPWRSQIVDREGAAIAHVNKGRPATFTSAAGETLAEIDFLKGFTREFPDRRSLRLNIEADYPHRPLLIAAWLAMGGGPQPHDSGTPV